MLLINLTEDNHGKAMVISKDKWLWKDLGCMLFIIDILLSNYLIFITLILSSKEESSHNQSPD
jgi:hypothetical protein